MPRHALRSELAAKLGVGWSGLAGRHALSSETPSPTGPSGRHALTSEVDAIVTAPPETVPTFHATATDKAFTISHTIGAIAGVRAGDVLVAFVAAAGGSQAVTTPAGWTQIGDTNTGAANVAARLRVYAKVAATANEAGGTWTWTESANHVVTILAYGGAASPAAAATVRADGQATINAPSQTSAAANAMLITYAFGTSNLSAPAWPGTMTVRSPNVGTSATGVAAEEARPTPGATGTRAFTAGGSPAFQTAASLVLEPA